MKTDNAIKMTKDIIGKIASAVRKADKILCKRYIYQIVVALAFIIMFVAFFDCFSSNKVYFNYDKERFKYTQLFSGAEYTQYFDAHGDTLRSFRLVINPDRSVLKSSDKANLKIRNSEGEVLLDKDFFLYNSSRSYIQVDCDDLSLTKGDRYSMVFSLENIDKDSYILVKTHQSINLERFGSNDRADDDITIDDDVDIVQSEIVNDTSLGFSQVFNIAYYYKTTNYAYAVVHFLFFGGLVAILFIDKLMKHQRIKEVLRAFGLPIMLILLAEMLNVESNSGIRIFGPMTLKHWFVLLSAVVIIGAFYFMLYMLTGLGTLSCTIVSFLLALIAYTNHVKLVMRGDTFMPWDLVSAGIAVKTGSTYYFHVTVNFVVSIIFAVAIVCFIRLTATRRYAFSRVRLAMMGFATAVFLLSIFGLVLNTKLLNKAKVYYEVYPPFQSYNENGTYMAFLYHMNNIHARGKDNNSPEATTELIYYYESQVASQKLNKNVVHNDVKPNVICIMSEAYCDLNEIRELETSEPATPYYDSLVEGTRNGPLAVSIFGGGTCNTEFEFLTGYSMSSLLPGSSVYSFYINHETEALPAIFGQNGYRTVALHSFDGDWWDRREKYPLLGFNEFYTRDDFPEDAHYVRRYISDMDTFHKITDIYEQSEDPLFLFCVTMQNHADFSEHYDNMAYDIKINNVVKPDGEHFNYAENYLSLLRESDDALKYLIEYLSQSDEPTIVVFFGDHLPTLDAGFYDTMLNTDLGTVNIDDSVELYNTQYFVWANYDISEHAGEDGITSANFLGQDVLDLAGIRSPETRSCLRVLESKIAAISSVAVYDKEGNPHTDYSTLSRDELNNIEDYSFIQYGLIYYEEESEEQ